LDDYIIPHNAIHYYTYLCNLNKKICPQKTLIKGFPGLSCKYWCKTSEK
jgi:hypothetical protein